MLHAARKLLPVAAMSRTDVREHASRLRLGLTAVAVMQPLFWFCRRGVDPTEVHVQGMRVAVVIGALAVIAFTYHRAFARWAQEVAVVAIGSLLLACTTIAAAEDWGTQYLIAPTIIFFVTGALATNRLESAVVVGIAATAPVTVILWHGWQPNALAGIPPLLLTSAAIGGAIVSWYRSRSQETLTEEIRRREQLEGDLRGMHAHLESILNATSDGILGVQYGGEGPRISFANRRFGEIFDLAPASVVGVLDRDVRARAARSFRHPDEFERNVAWMYANPAAVRVDELELVCPRPSILERWSGPVRDVQGDIVGRIWAFRDVSEQRAMVRERDEHAARLETANAELERAGRAKDVFLANLSHELRTPLSVIIGYLNLVIEGGLSADECRDFLERSSRSAIHLLQLISDMLDLTRLESGTAVIAVEPLAVRPVVEEVRSLTEVLARNRGLRLVVSAAPEAMVLADRQRLKQVLLNLVGNALKFTDAGSVTVTAVPENGHVAFVVHDTGRGVPVEQQEMLFAKFMRLDSRPTAPEDGVGLGLSICRELVTLMGGEIALASAGVDQGTEVRFTLPRVEERRAQVADS